MPEQKENWEKEFDSRFKYILSEKDPDNWKENINDKNAIKLFIHKAISEAVEDERKRVAKFVEGMRFMYEPPYAGDKDEDMEREWKRIVIVLNDVLSIINKE